MVASLYPPTRLIATDALARNQQYNISALQPDARRYFRDPIIPDLKRMLSDRVRVGVLDDKTTSLLAYLLFGSIARTMWHPTSAPTRCPMRTFLSDLRSVAVHSTDTLVPWLPGHFSLHR